MSKRMFVGQGNVHELAKKLKIAFPNAGMSCTLVDEAHNEANDTMLLVFEKYFMRVKNRVSLSILIYPFMDKVKVDLIGSGSGQGPFLKFSWGSEESIVDTAAQILFDLGFKQVT